MKRAPPASLMRLAVPTGWAVLFNNFCDVEPSEETYDAYFSQDLLWIAEARYEGSEFRTADAGHFSIDLGWYGGVKDGAYRLELARVGQEKPISSMRSRDRNAVRDAVEGWLKANAF